MHLGAHSPVPNGTNGISDLQVVQGRNGVFVIPNSEALDLSGRIIRFGKVGEE